MGTDSESHASQEPQPITSFTVFGARLTWSVLGPLALALVTMGIVSKGNGWLTVLDVIFGVIILWMLLGRWVEYRSGQGTSTSGERTTRSDFRRYVAGLLGMALALFVLSNVLGNHVLA